MPQSLARLVIHITFSTKDRAPLLLRPNSDRLYAYMAGILHGMQCRAIRIGGATDHVHVLSTISRTLALADLIEVLKKDSSKWAKRDGRISPEFNWQRGYGAFSVSESNVPRVTTYIDRQQTHHTKTTFQDEFRALCRKHNIDYDERYVWD